MAGPCWGYRPNAGFRAVEGSHQLRASESGAGGDNKCLTFSKTTPFTGPLIVPASKMKNSPGLGRAEVVDSICDVPSIRLSAVCEKLTRNPVVEPIRAVATKSGLHVRKCKNF
ncbi:hypothetical protein XHV734_1979 [Xanthomonas hortorum pv. vitians]|nr:hypothetical protein XHV734_1979 [Xanthomonas hortorum pv. vitians]